MTEASREERTSTSGGTMRLLTQPPTTAVPDLARLASLRRVVQPGKVRPAGGPPYLAEGQIVTWHYGAWTDVLRVVRDDERGLVAWLPSDSERLTAIPRDGRGLRDRSLAERAALSVAREYDMVVRGWQGPGLLRIAPTGVPWSLWYFRDDRGAFEGHYLNLELVHERPVDGSPRVHTRDLVLDLWLENGETWLKDADELDAGVEAGWCTAEQAGVIRDIAEQARSEQIDPGAWPLDEGWESWQPPPEWDEPLTLPRDVVDIASAGPTVGTGQ
ncbi:MAG TPA: DUF402 domain-containing protein [Nocardioides sp.]|uniref:DUF402 domain-containing protein n=1 Tax=Nocardioides sp. TaxID=35761 RepID=UPI002F425C7D